MAMGMEIAVLTARTLDTILPNVPLRFLPNASSEPRGRLEPMVVFDSSAPWPRVAVEVDGITVSLTPDETVQGRAMALTIAQFQWGRSQILRCRSKGCERMKAAFTAELKARSPAGDRSFRVVGEVTLEEPPDEEEQGGLARRAWEDALLEEVDMDCAKTRIMVLMVDTREMAEAVFNAAARASWGDSAVVFIGSYQTTVASNVPRGMLGLRPTTNDLPVGVLQGNPSKELWEANQGNPFKEL
ncbi:hypothetical protein T484DRAFT_1803796 [Baffinella frigidus]|nr:hypothetical protein T484DRAFT_1803796 [Cryptophyta sp. CCMP2293]